MAAPLKPRHDPLIAASIATAIQYVDELVGASEDHPLRMPAMAMAAQLQAIVTRHNASRKGIADGPVAS